ncbi:MAG: CubicO group peptidase (beta-lactamase class C family) [Candidatus Azotimanducaceae bacterium]|jgi:CubicO group peptidase (beta-lactamase class C family)
MRFRKIIGVMTVAILVTACGGGNSTPASAPASSSAPAPAPVDNQAGTATSSGVISLEPTWTLERAPPEALNIASSDVESILTHIFTDRAVQSATLVKDGYIIGEMFSAGVDANTLGTSWSVAKSFYSAAIGIAIEQGWINGLDQKASDFLTQWQGTNKENITIRHLLEMRSGLGDPGTISRSRNQTEHAINTIKISAEDSQFFYSNPTSQLFEPILRTATGVDAHTYLRQELLLPIGIDPNLVGMWLDPTGVNPLTYMGLDMRPVDMARFGLLYARGGKWEANQVVPQTFVQQSLSTQSVFYGFQWWRLNNAYFGQATPISISAALGLNGQKIYVWAEQDVVLVVQTQYQHNQNQGYILSELNFPNTCSGRNSCPNSTGSDVPRYNERELMVLLSALTD